MNSEKRAHQQVYPFCEDNNGRTQPCQSILGNGVVGIGWALESVRVMGTGYQQREKRADDCKMMGNGGAGRCRSMGNG